MDNSVMIKGYKDGILLILDPDMPFENLLDIIRNKFESSAKFLGSAKLALTFSGRDLSVPEQKEVLRVISEVCNVEIICVFDNNDSMEDIMKKTVDTVISSLSTQSGKFFYGSVQNGSHIETESSLVIIGNIEAGGCVSCGGSLVVLGHIFGSATAGTNGNTEAIIYASGINAEHLQIVNRIYSTDGIDPKEEKKRLKAEAKSHLDRAAKLVSIHDDMLCINPVEEETFRFDITIGE